jgi:nucleotide-binding universal stress UspA family protein
MRFQKILCPIDFSAGSQKAMQVAVRLANEADAELVLAHAWYLPPNIYDAYVFPPHVVEQITGDAERGLEAALRDAVTFGAKRVSAKLLNGLPWAKIVDLLASDPAFDLAVLGTHGRTGLAQVMLGSMAEKVIRHAPCSVLAVRSDAEPRPFQHVLCPVDFSVDSDHALELVASLIQPGGTGITLLHVVEIPIAYFGDRPVTDVVHDLGDRSAQLLARAAAQLQASVSVPVTTRSRDGRFPGAQLLEAIEEDPTIDLVVMGSHGRTGLQRLLLGSVAEKVVRHARCPVLVARRRTQGQ